MIKKVLIIGMGKSGQAAAAFVVSRGDAFVGVDRSGEVRTKVPGVVADAPVSEFDLVIVSPGVSPTEPIYAEARRLGKEIVGEAELALSVLRQPCIGITGTNGKTTVTLLVEHILKSAGRKARALGNVGDPLSTYAIHPDPEEILVVEMSSYQLETMARPVFDVAVILNITPDHLDRYPSMEAYAAAKCRIQGCLKPGAPLYVHLAVVREFGQLLQSRVRVCPESDVSAIQSQGIQWAGAHERENLLAAWAIVEGFGVTREQFIQAASSFQKPAHRIQFVGEVGGVRYFDDSKGTNIDAAIRAVDAMRGRVVLIAGGVDKGAPYLPWKKAFQGKVKKIFAIGEAAPKILQELGSEFPVELVGSLDEAVERAHAFAERGDDVLLSPGCSSFDMFRDYAHRGEEFQKSVRRLQKG
jgi:UDP-N-acetylmuramoylalanine--D-glutamate ligase